MSAFFDLIQFLAEAVATPSHEDPTAMREFLVETLAEYGHDATVDEAGNVLATRGRGDPHYVLNTHLDTVPPHVPYDRTDSPPAGVADAGEVVAATGTDVIRGRGACDAKGPLAALLAAFLGADPDGRLTLTVTPDEERLSTGAHHLVERDDSPLASADGVIVGEPTGLDVCTAARGRYEATVTIGGEPGHAADPHAGANAVRAAAPVIQAIEEFDRETGTPSHDQLGPPTLTITGIEGGEATNRTPATCRLTIDRRPVPPETAAAFRDGLESHLREWIGDPFDVTVSLVERPTPFLSAFATDSGESLVRTLSGAARAETAVGSDADASAVRLDGAGDVRPFGAATEAAYFADVAPTVVFGPGDLADAAGAVAHAEREYVRVAEARAAARILETALKDLV
jgi:acetylornithine deacetylase/succinyl-diaminopimelate desuccinylase-like protein